MTWFECHSNDVAGRSWTCILSLIRTMRQSTIPADMRGRVFLNDSLRIHSVVVSQTVLVTGEKQG